MFRKILVFLGVKIFVVFMMVNVAFSGTWRLQRSFSASLMYGGIDFVNRQLGWVAGIHPTLLSVVLHSKDGGRTWHNQIDGIQSMFPMDVGMANTNKGWISGVGMFKVFGGGSQTENGGRIWKPLFRDYWLITFQDLSVVDENHVWMAGAFYKGQDQKEGVMLSSDGGETWEGYDWGIDTSPRYIHFVDAQYGWIAGGMWPTEETSASKGSLTLWEKTHELVRNPKSLFVEETSASKAQDTYRGVIARSTDGGKTWQKMLDDSGRFYFNGIHFVDRNKGWAVCEGDTQAYILHSSDGGEHWEQQYESPTDLVYSLLQIYMVNDQVGWAVGGKGQGSNVKGFILHTQDGGKTWQEDTIMGDSRYYFMDVDFVSTDEGWACGTNSVHAAIFHYESAGAKNREN